MSDTMNVRRVAELAKIALTGQEEVRLQAEMEEILMFARRLQAIDVQNVPETQHILPVVNVLRWDEACPSLPREQILAAAPAREDVFMAVPRTVE